MSEKIDHSNNPNPIWSDFSTPKEAHTTNDELATYTQELSQKDVISQIKTISELVQKAENAEIPFEEIFVRKFFEKIQQNKTFPPIIKCLAKSLCPDPNSGEIVETPVFPSDPDNFRLYLPFQELDYDSPYIGMTNEEEILQKQEELLLRLESKYAAKIQVDEDGNKLYPDEMYYPQASIMTEADWAIKNLKFQKGQQKLHDKYPTLPENSNLIRIASDAAGAISFNRLLSENEWILDEPLQNFTTSIDLVSDKNGNIISLESPEEPNSLGIDKNTAFLLQTIHGQEETRNIIEASLNLSLSKISLTSQVSLLEFMSKSDNSRFDNLCSTLHKIDDEDLRIKLLENFIATDFGEDFGDSLLDIVNSNKISPEQIKEILESIISCRKSIDGITSLYDNFDQGSFSEQYKKASNERLTDIITVFREIAKNGSAKANLGRFGEISLSLSEALEALYLEEKSLEIISGTITDLENGISEASAEVILPKIDLPTEEAGNRTLYNLYSPNHGNVLLYTRSKASKKFNPLFEYGGKTGVEASISFMTNPTSPSEQLNPYRSPKTPIVSALRIDREGKSPDKSHGTQEEDPTTKYGTISVDLGSIANDKNVSSGKIARLIATGNILRGQLGPNSEFQYNHSVEKFDQEKYGSELIFEGLVTYIDEQVSKWCESFPPEHSQKIAGKYRQLERQTGEHYIK